MDKLSRILVALVALYALAFGRGAQAYSGPWHKGQFHLHTWWDDGNTFPEVAIERYRAAGFAIVGWTDHYHLHTSDTAVQWGHDGGSLDASVAEYVAQLPDRLETGDSGDGGGWLYKLRRFANTKWFFEQERDASTRVFVTSAQELTPLAIESNNRAHVVVIGHAMTVTAEGGATSTAVYDAAVSRARDMGVAPESGLAAPLTIVAHPNWNDAGLAPDIRHLDVQGIEIYSGHSHTLPHGGGPSQMTPPAARVTWDLVDQWRLAQGLPLVYAFAGDDAHDYYGVGPRQPFKAWVEIEASASPTEDELLSALEAGAFFATTGARPASYSVSTVNGARCLSIAAGNARDRVTVYGVLRDTGYAVPTRVVATGRGSLATVCPNPGTFGLARWEIRDVNGKWAWGQHVRVWEGDDP